MAYKTKYTPTNPTKYIGNINSILCRSLWERKFCKYLDTNMNVVRWSFEAVRVPYLSPVDNKVHFYIPDFLIEIKKGNLVETLLIEIKPKKQTKRPEANKKQKKTILMENLTYAVNIAKWKAAEKYCNENGIKFKILTEEDLF
jgi:hypothetical protein